jgi:hypothetical protein
MEDGGWLNKFDQGGMVLEQQRDDNYGKKPNPNDVQVSVGPDFVGLGYNTKGRNYSPAWGGQFVMGGALPGAVGFTYARTIDPAPSNGKYAKKTKASAQNGQEMKFYQEGLDFTPKTISQNGSVIKDDMGQWAHPGEITEIGSNEITMQGVDYPVLGISDTGDTQIMYPDQDYKFDGEKVTEYPMMKEGGWLSKYQDGGGVLSRSNLETMTALEKDIKNQKARNAQETVSQYTPKPGDQQRMNTAKDVYRAEETKPLNKLSRNPHIVTGSKNLAGAAEFASEVASVASMATGIGSIGINTLRLGASALNKAIGKNILSRTVRNFASNVSPYINSVDDIAAYAQGDAIGIMGNSLNKKLYNPNIALNTVNNTLTGVNRNIKNSSIEAADIALGSNNVSPYKNINSEIDNVINNDAAGSIDDIINKWWRRETAPGTKHEDAINVLNEFKQRIKTPEGQKRLKELGISNDEFLQKLKIIEDNTEYGYYNDGKIGLHKDVPNVGTVTRHEIEHGVQGALGRDALMAAKKGTVDDKMAALNVGPTKIDDILSKLELRKTPNKVVRRPENLNDIYLDPYEFNRRMSDKQAATDYFTYGSEGREKSAFAAEAQQYMLDKGIIKHPYENITPDKVRNAMIEAQFDKETYPIRLFHIMKNTDNNYKTVSDALNKMLTVSPILAGGAATLAGSKEKKNGGWLNKYK